MQTTNEIGGVTPKLKNGATGNCSVLPNNKTPKTPVAMNAKNISVRPARRNDVLRLRRKPCAFCGPLHFAARASIPAPQNHNSEKPNNDATTNEIFCDNASISHEVCSAETADIEYSLLTRARTFAS